MFDNFESLKGHDLEEEGLDIVHLTDEEMSKLTAKVDALRNSIING